MSNFIDVSTRLQENFNRIVRDPNTRLFVVNLDKDELWNLYLKSFPEGTNEIYRVRREYDCSCCRHFIKSVGNVVYIDDNFNVHSIFEFNTGSDIFQPVMDAMAEYVTHFRIYGPFYTNSKFIGAPMSRWLNPSTHQVITFNHFSLTVPDRFVIPKRSIRTVAYEIGHEATNQQLFLRTMNDVSMEAFNTVIELIDAGNLYRGEEWKDILMSAKTYKRDYDSMGHYPLKQGAFAWKISASAGPVLSRLRNHSIGTLLLDITNGVDIDKAVRKYEAIVAPSNYKRPKPIYTKRMLEDAEKKVMALGYYESLPRRFAKVNDINIRDISYIDRDTLRIIDSGRKTIFDLMKEEVDVVNPKSFEKAETMSFDEFMKSDILRNKLYALFENRHASNLVSLIAPANTGAKSMFKWNNGFSWAYNGNMTDSDIRENVKAAGGTVDAYMRFSIQWNDGMEWDKNDLDAHCLERYPTIWKPGYGRTGEAFEIYYMSKKSPFTNGQLDIDIIDPIENKAAVENIFYTNKSQLVPGAYDFFVVCYTYRGGTSGFRAELEIDGEIRRFDYKAPMNRSGMMVQVATVTVHPNGNYTVEEHMPSSMSNRDIWGIKTNTFVPISMIMESPNYWGDNKVGNRHHMIMLKGCVNPDSPNGFYNEFLSNELIENRKVFEALGSRMRVPESEDQLSGLGFSSTKRNDIIIKAVDEQNRNRYVRITF